jgi:hypothetical protein
METSKAVVKIIIRFKEEFVIDKSYFPMENPTKLIILNCSKGECNINELDL